MGSQKEAGFLAKAILALAMMVLLLQALPAVAQEANSGNEIESAKNNYAFSVWATGGTYKNKFSFTFEGAYAKNFNGIFGQVAVMTNYYDGMGEYGLSLGFGQQNTAFEWYVFADNVYNTHFWTQIRGVVGVNVGWLRASGTYTIPLQKPIKINELRETRIEPVKKFDFSIIPFSWLRIYGNYYLIGKGNIHQKYDFGVEIRPVKIISLRVDWNKSSWEQESVRDLNADWSLYSGWHMQNDLRITLNLILGSSRDLRQYPKKRNTRIIEVLWPMEVAGNQGGPEEDTTPKPITILMEYERWNGGDVQKPDDCFPTVAMYKGGTIYFTKTLYTKTGEKFSSNLNIETNIIYTGYIVDLAMNSGQVALHVWINGVYAINLNGNDTPYGTFKFKVKNDGTVEFLSK